MESLSALYRIGVGPSASHTMGPRLAAEAFGERFPQARRLRVTLFGSLAATGKGHLTDKAIRESFSPSDVHIIWKPDEQLPAHPNGIQFEALDDAGDVIGQWIVYSVGGGALRDGSEDGSASLYALTTMNDIIAWACNTGKPIWEYVNECEGAAIWEHLRAVWDAMQACIDRGFEAEGVLPGDLRLPRKASSYYVRARREGALSRTSLISAYALAVAEENASGGVVVTAPTCGSCGIVPAVLRYVQEKHGSSDTKILRALATAGIVGNLVKTNASISGAEVGCQGEVGTACAMAAAAAAQLLGGTPRQIEYAAEIGMEHHLGLTCDPVDGLVQIPCIERNAFAAMRATDCAEFAILSDGSHHISFDEVVDTMKQTGADLQKRYRETSTGGLAEIYRVRRESFR